MRPLLACLLFAAGCLGDGDCDRDQLAQHGVCLALPVASTVDAGPTPDADGDAGPQPAISQFGNVCTAQGQCGADTDMCALFPGASEGFCSHSLCLGHEEVCPAGWRCYDASVYQAGFSLCIP